MSRLNAAVIPVTPFQQNCTLLLDEETRRAAVIDPGGDVPRILAAIDRHGAAVEKIVLTHGHIDHAGGAAALKEALEQRRAAAAARAACRSRGPIRAIASCSTASPRRAAPSA